MLQCKVLQPCLEFLKLLSHCLNLQTFYLRALSGCGFQLLLFGKRPALAIFVSHPCECVEINQNTNGNEMSEEDKTEPIWHFLRPSPEFSVPLRHSVLQPPSSTPFLTLWAVPTAFFWWLVISHKAQLKSNMTSILLGVLVATTAATGESPVVPFPHNITFGRPVMLGNSSTLGIAPLLVQYDQIGVFGVVLPSGDVVVSTDGGITYSPSTYARVPRPTTTVLPDLRGETPGEPLKGTPPLHDMGHSGMTVADMAAGNTNTTEWHLDKNGARTDLSGLPVHVAGLSDHATLHFSECGAVIAGNGHFLRTAVVTSPNATETGLVSIVSTDGFTWTYQSRIAEPRQEPLELTSRNAANDVVMLDYGMLMAVQAGGAYSISLDGGASWSQEESFNISADIAHPRLVLLGDGFAPLVMSSGGASTNSDLDFWVEWFGLGPAVPPLPPRWERHSLSYWHNSLVPEGQPRFPASVNLSKSSATTGRTQVAPVSKCSAVVVYDVVDGSGGYTAFAMRVDMHLNVSGEIGVIC
eukprot:m.61199 g.61199  ORF g.61199 m.61199 type:complete len:525 (-) comp9546_c0_seq2:1234-2808(-)